MTAVFGPALARASVTVDAATPLGLAISGPAARPVRRAGELPGHSAVFRRLGPGRVEPGRLDVLDTLGFASAWDGSHARHGLGAGHRQRPSQRALRRHRRKCARHDDTRLGCRRFPSGHCRRPFPPVCNCSWWQPPIFPDGVQLDVTSRAVWTSLSPNVASIANGPHAGWLTARNPGSAQVTCSFEGITVGAAVEVSSATLTSVTILPNLPGGAVGSEVPLMAQGSFSDGSQFDLTQQARWSSANAGGGGRFQRCRNPRHGHGARR